jgi:hypothetical protein
LADLAYEADALIHEFGDLAGLDLSGVDLSGLGADLAVKDAAAAPPTMLACDKTRVITSTSATLVETNTTYYAELDVPGLDPTSALVHGSLCNYEYFGLGYDALGPYPCPPGSTCTDTGYSPPAAAVPCQSFAGARIGQGKIVITCGSKLDFVYPASPAANQSSGWRATTVYVSVQ